MKIIYLLTINTIKRNISYNWKYFILNKSVLTNNYFLRSRFLLNMSLSNFFLISKCEELKKNLESFRYHHEGQNLWGGGGGGLSD